AGVERWVGDYLAYFVTRDAVGQRALQVPRQLVGPVHRGERRDCNQAAIALGESGPLPDVAEEYFLAQIDQLWRNGSHYVTGGGDGRLGAPRLVLSRPRHGGSR